MIDKQTLFNALMRRNLSAFIEKSFQTADHSQLYQPNWHIDVIADYLQRCASGEIKRLIINLPPRSLKSVCVSVAFPAWLLGHYPNQRVVCVSYADELAKKLARDCRTVMDAIWYKKAFPKTRINPNKRSEGEFETTEQGYRLATSTGGVLTGRGGGWIIIDDPLKPQDALSETRRKAVNQWFSSTLFSRLDNKQTGCIIVVMQRVHLDDLSAYVQLSEEWTVLSLPAIATKAEEFQLTNGKIYKREIGDILNPALESKETLDGQKQAMGTYNFSAQYQQEPIPASGNVINWDWFQFYQTLPEKKAGAQIYQSWDTAMKAHDGSDYSSCVTILETDKKYYVLNVYRAKLDFPALKKKIVEMKQAYGANIVIIEDKGSGTGLIQQLKAENFMTKAYEPKGDKADRIVAQSASIEAGLVYLPEGAPWLDDFRIEVISFPYGRNDDQIDALAQGLDYIRNRPRGFFDSHWEAPKSSVYRRPTFSTGQW